MPPKSKHTIDSVGEDVAVMKAILERVDESSQTKNWCKAISRPIKESANGHARWLRSLDNRFWGLIIALLLLVLTLCGKYFIALVT